MVTALNLLQATANQIEGQSGKAIPADRAELWLQLLGTLRMQLAQGT